VLHTHIEGRFRQALGLQAAAERDESIRFAIDFVNMLVRNLPEGAVSRKVRDALRAAVEARTDLKTAEIDVLLDLSLAPESRVAVSEDDLRAFGARFGPAEEAALRTAVAEELDLAGFAERHGPEEGLLLLDALFGVSAVDGVIDRVEIGRLTRAAENLGIDAMLIGALFRKHDVRHASGDLTIRLDKDRYVIGRATNCEVPLPDPAIALRHVELQRTSGGWRVVDLGSGRPTLLNGNPVSSAPFKPGDQLRLASYTFSLDRDGTTLAAFGTRSFSSLSIRSISRRIGSVSLLDDVRFTVFTGEVIAVVGPSGAGKTTLLNAIAGIAPPDKGEVLFDGQDFHRLLAADRSVVGIVPQDDVVHADLTVEESLQFTARLRFPTDTPRSALQGEVDRVLGELDIDHIRRSRIGDAVRRGISGGQRKRVNLGQELLTRTTRVLFLDEPTSGLDPQTAQDIVSLIRQLADGGRIIFLVTHDVTPTILGLVDHLMVLAPGGRLAWFGPPTEASRWFEVASVDGIFGRLTEAKPTEWSERFRNGPVFRKYVRTREHLLGFKTADEAGDNKRKRPLARMRRSRFRQYLTLTRRYWRVKLRDRAGTNVLLAQAPILGTLMWLVFPEPDAPAMFMLALSTLWFGASASVRELIADRAIWRREARVGIGVTAYLGSKLTVLGALVTLQCLALASLVWMLLGMGGVGPDGQAYGTSWVLLCATSALTGLVGMALGLLISASFASSEAAVGTLPLLLIPQITFGGLIVKIKEMGLVAKAFSYLMIVRYSFDAAIKASDKLTDPVLRGGTRHEKSIMGILYDLGLRGSSAADDVGLPLVALYAVLSAFLVALVGATCWRTWRSKEGN
jgi:ABC-type multidrug transport system ATPase subunit